MEIMNYSKVSTSLKIYDTYIFPISRAIDSLTFGKIIGKNLVLRAVKK